MALSDLLRTPRSKASSAPTRPMKTNQSQAGLPRKSLVRTSASSSIIKSHVSCVGARASGQSGASQRARKGPQRIRPRTLRSSPQGGPSTGCSIGLIVQLSGRHDQGRPGCERPLSVRSGAFQLAPGWLDEGSRQKQLVFRQQFPALQILNDEQIWNGSAAFFAKTFLQPLMTILKVQDSMLIHTLLRLVTRPKPGGYIGGKLVRSPSASFAIRHHDQGRSSEGPGPR